MDKDNKKIFKVALLQVQTGLNKMKNLQKTQKLIERAVDSSNNADVIILPQFFNSPYNMKVVEEYAEEGEIINEQAKLPYDFTNHSPPNTLTFLSNMAKYHNKHIIGGSIPIKKLINNQTVYSNTCYCFDNNGQIVSTFDKMHLCQINVKDQIKFDEGQIITPGNKFTYFDTPFARVTQRHLTFILQFGIAICYDIRFPQLHLLLTQKYDINFMVYPAALNKTFGPMQFDLFARSRAVDTQSYVAVCSPAVPGQDGDDYPGYGHSHLVDPWGNTIQKLSEQQDLIVAEINMNEVDKVRQMIPISKQRRKDIYQLKQL